jgi:hypothetical protein
MSDRVFRERGRLRVPQLVVVQELGRNFRDRPDTLLAPVGDVVEDPLEFLPALLLGVLSDGFPLRFARFLDAAAGEREVVPPDLRLHQFAGLFVSVFGSVNGHIDLRLSLLSLSSSRRHGRSACLSDGPYRLVHNPPDWLARLAREPLQQCLRLGAD